MFLELNSEAIEAEVDEYTRELYKIQKVFNNKVKKLQIEKEERDRERKRKRRMAEEDGEALPEEEEDTMQIPQAVNVCNTVMDNMRDFKVGRLPSRGMVRVWGLSSWSLKGWTQRTRDKSCRRRRRGTSSRLSICALLLCMI